MEADSTGLDSVSDKGIQDNDIGSTSRTPNEESRKSEYREATDINKSMQNVLNITSELFNTVEDVHSESSLKQCDQEGDETSKDEVQTDEEGSSKSNYALDNIRLSDQEMIKIEECVLKKYTGLNMDLASENQLLKEDVIQCRCELEKYGKRLSCLENKLDKANSYNEDLRQQVEKLSAMVHEYRSEKHKLFIHIDTQTSADDFMEVDDTLYDVNIPGDKPDDDMSLDWKLDTEQADGMSIADSLKATAEAAMSQTGYVYDEQSGLYYDYNTGYYYNAEKGLYYDPKSGTYFYYNKATGKYEFHSRVDLSYYTGVTDIRPHHSHHRHSDRYSDRYSERSERSPEYSSSGKKKKKKDSKRRDSDDRDSKRRSSRSSEEKESRRHSDEKDRKKKKKRKKEKRSRSISSGDDRKDEKKRKTSRTDDEKRKKKEEEEAIIGEVNYKQLKQSEKLKHDSKPKLLTEKTGVDICDDVDINEGPAKGDVLASGKKIKLVLKKKEKDSNDSAETDSAKKTGEIEDEENTSQNPDVDDLKTSGEVTQGNNGESIVGANRSASKSDTNDVKSEKEDETKIDMFADDGTISYSKVGIVNSDEILKICAQLNNEDTDDENESMNKQCSPKAGGGGKDDTEKTDKKIDDETSQVLGVKDSQDESKEKIIKIPVKEGDIYSDEDDIMIIEKEEEKILIELDSDSDDENLPQQTESLQSSSGLEPGELESSSSSSSSSDSSSSSSSSQSKSQPSWVEIVRQPTPASEESTMKNAPCIRAMVNSSDILDEGMLFIVTIKGGIVGREPRTDLVIPIPDINVSKVHAEIKYNSKEQIYTIQDKGSQNGTFVNEERISESKKESVWKPLIHGDTLQISCTRFDIHVHPGTDTCDTCEPGLTIQKSTGTSLSSKDIQLDRKQQLKNIKKKYGLANSSYADNVSAIKNPSYQDKAAERRRTVGSDCPVQKPDQSSSVHVKIQEDNKGHQMLKKLGWTEGESLGKDNSGIQEPINVNMRVDQQAGLGAFGKANEISIDSVGLSKAAGLSKARMRFSQTQMRVKGDSVASNKDQSFKPLMWVQGQTQKPDDELNK